ncbi:MAG: hypothetical protein A2849_02670 [Candidatus Taylorbacteria bacterium RIFCSPHIGHO2_01_FULL_51_15]|uniref:YgjP-like metallopeptidase domain-containing protein n=1 Tax=Candidatus Taylorbacteria bacterium RIFCSPHIGHO2_01_FULL_51_15 TaxID=1802304 RepID=A0A1G2MFJ3_9BACT|nr:MAG: hypothetical protein A2849_02670 [Candidatus Taylorbacteria bacterium RIFCSPHIGHO2_01_FULL_51_15]
MEKTITLEKKTVRYTLLTSRRAKHLRLSIARGGIFTVTTPLKIPQGVVEAFIVRKSAWVLRNLSEFGRLRRLRKVPSRGRRALLLRESTRALVHERLARFNAFYQCRWGRVSVRNQKRRWGSCSRKGNLNFNYRIALLPSHLADYIIVHELCHLRELNHSSRFWDLVAKTLPNHRDLKRELREFCV